MAHFLKIKDEDGHVSYVNLDYVVEVDEGNHEIMLLDGSKYVFLDAWDGNEWPALMRFVKDKETK